MGMEETINRNILKHAVGRRMACPACKKILDARRAVLVTDTDGGCDVFCTSCVDESLQDRFLASGDVAEIHTWKGVRNV